MTAQEGGAHGSPSSFLSHLEHFHPTCLHGVNHIPNVMNDMRIFRSTVCGLPQDEIVNIVSCIQEVSRLPRIILPQPSLMLASIVPDVHPLSASITAR